MKQIIITAILSCLLVITNCSAETFPPRKPGLWSVDVSPGGGKGIGEVTQCIDRDTDEMMQKAALSGPDGAKNKCSKNDISKIAGGYSLYSECKVGGSSVVTEGTLIGSFDTAYKGDMLVRYTPPLFGQKESKVTMSAKWLGPCPKDMKPGDMRLPNGMKMNLLSMQKQASAATELLGNPETQKMLQNAIKGLEGASK